MGKGVERLKDIDYILDAIREKLMIEKAVKEAAGINVDSIYGRQLTFLAESNLADLIGRTM